MSATLTEQVYACLTAAAESGSPCPTNVEIAQALGITRKCVGGLMSKLNTSGVIKTQWPEGTKSQRRIVTITATGVTMHSDHNYYSGTPHWMELPWPKITKPKVIPDYRPHDDDPGDDLPRFVTPATYVPTVNTLHAAPQWAGR